MAESNEVSTILDIHESGGQISPSPSNSTTTWINERVLRRVLSSVSTASGSLRELFKRDPSLPCFSTVQKYRMINPDFDEAYKRALSIRAGVMAEDILEIADNATDDVQMGLTRGLEAEKINPAAIQRAKLQVNTRQWLMSRYSDDFNPAQKQEVISSGKGTDDFVKQRLRQLKETKSESTPIDITPASDSVEDVLDVL